MYPLNNCIYYILIIVSFPSLLFAQDPFDPELLASPLDNVELSEVQQAKDDDYNFQFFKKLESFYVVSLIKVERLDKDLHWFGYANYVETIIYVYDLDLNQVRSFNVEYDGEIVNSSYTVGIVGTNELAFHYQTTNNDGSEVTFKRKIYNVEGEALSSTTLIKSSRDSDKSIFATPNTISREEKSVYTQTDYANATSKQHDDEWANGNSVLNILTLAAGSNELETVSYEIPIKRKFIYELWLSPLEDSGYRLLLENSKTEQSWNNKDLDNSAFFSGVLNEDTHTIDNFTKLYESNDYFLNCLSKVDTDEGIVVDGFYEVENKYFGMFSDMNLTSGESKCSTILSEIDLKDLESKNYKKSKSEIHLSSSFHFNGLSKTEKMSSFFFERVVAPTSRTTANRGPHSYYYDRPTSEYKVYGLYSFTCSDSEFKLNKLKERDYYYVTAWDQNSVGSFNIGNDTYWLMNGLRKTPRYSKKGKRIGTGFKLDVVATLSHLDSDSSAEITAPLYYDRDMRINTRGWWTGNDNTEMVFIATDHELLGDIKKFQLVKYKF